MLLSAWNGKSAFCAQGMDHQGDVLGAFPAKRRDRKAAHKGLKRAIERYGRPNRIGTNRLRSQGAVKTILGRANCYFCGLRTNDRPSVHDSHLDGGKSPRSGPNENAGPRNLRPRSELR